MLGEISGSDSDNAKHEMAARSRRSSIRGISTILQYNKLALYDMEWYGSPAYSVIIFYKSCAMQSQTN